MFVETQYVNSQEINGIEKVIWLNGCLIHAPPPPQQVSTESSLFVFNGGLHVWGSQRGEAVCSSSASKSDLKGYLTTLSASKEQREVKRQLCIIVMGKNTAV